MLAESGRRLNREEIFAIPVGIQILVAEGVTFGVPGAEQDWRLTGGDSGDRPISNVGSSRLFDRPT